MLIYLFLTLFLFVPGYLISNLCRSGAPGYLLCFSLSFSFLILNLAVFDWLRIPATVFTAVVGTEIALLCLLNLALPGARANFHGLRRIIRGNHVHVFAAISLVTGVLGYLHYAGIYTEVPADVWRHLGYTQSALTGVDEGYIVTYPTIWYTLPAWFIRLAGTDIYGFILHFGTASTILYCLGLYTFSYKVARKLTSEAHGAAFIAVLAVLISAFSVGVDVFSYARYYIFGPTFQNILVYFCCLCLVIDIFESNRVSVGNIVLLAVFSLTMYIVHEQELAFLFSIVLSMSIVIALRSFKSGAPTLPRPTLVDGVFQVHATWAALVTFAFTTLIFLYSRYSLPPQSDLHPWIVPISTFLPFGDHIYIADPAGQTYTSVTIWGLLVYTLFAFNLKLFRHDLYILSGMLIPLVTVFNPVFVDLFFRHNEAFSIYRFIYVVPLGLVAAVLIANYLNVLLRDAWHRKVTASVAILSLAILLLPVQLPLLQNHYSRVHTLRPVPEGNDYSLWRDMLEFVIRTESGRVITDPVTAYMLRGLGTHGAWSYKFHRSYPDLEKFSEQYAQYSGAMVVVNQRNGALSENGRRSGHWPEQVLQLGQYYPRSMLDLVEAESGPFHLFWQHNQIRIYLLDVNPQDALSDN